MGYDSLVVSSEKEKIVDGRYKIDMCRTVTGGGTNANYDIILNLTAKDKHITLSRSEPVHWNKGPLKGHT